MNRGIGVQLVLLIALPLVIVCSAQPAIIEGINFPDGAASFADVVVNFNPGNNASNNPSFALGVPDDLQVSLGTGGSIILQFTDNFLTGSGNSNPDLWIFEDGAAEISFVEISKDGSNWFSVGSVPGLTAGIDIDAFGFNRSDLFSFVRITDDPNDGADLVAGIGGGDIDAVGAIATPVPLPSTLALFSIGILGLIGINRRRLQKVA